MHSKKHIGIGKKELLKTDAFISTYITLLKFLFVELCKFCLPKLGSEATEMQDNVEILNLTLKIVDS